MVRVLEGMRQQGRKPEAIVIDNGPEFVSQVVDQWAYENGVQLHFITPTFSAACEAGAAAEEAILKIEGKPVPTYHQ